jgi:hypothetical protein
VELQLEGATIAGRAGRWLGVLVLIAAVAACGEREVPVAPLPLETAAKEYDRPREVEVPSDAARTIQQAIDLVSPGGVVHIKPGEYREHLSITKIVHIEGGGARGKRRTAIVDDRRTEIPSIRESLGLATYYAGGGGSLKDIALIGGDVAVLGVDQGGDVPLALQIDDAVLEGNVRGIAGSFSELRVFDTVIGQALSNGVSLICLYQLLHAVDFLVNASEGVGLFIVSCDSSAEVEISNSSFNGNAGGGIVIAGPLNLFGISNSNVNLNGDFGMLLFETGPKSIIDTKVIGTIPGSDQVGGQGIAVVGGEPMFVLASQIAANSDAGILLTCSPEAKASFVDTQIVNNEAGIVGGSFTLLGDENIVSNPGGQDFIGCEDELGVPAPPPLPSE